MFSFLSIALILLAPYPSCSPILYTFSPVDTSRGEKPRRKNVNPPAPSNLSSPNTPETAPRRPSSRHLPSYFHHFSCQVLESVAFCLSSITYSSKFIMRTSVLVAASAGTIITGLLGKNQLHYHHQLGNHAGTINLGSFLSACRSCLYSSLTRLFLHA